MPRPDNWYPPTLNSRLLRTEPPVPSHRWARAAPSATVAAAAQGALTPAPVQDLSQLCRYWCRAAAAAPCWCRACRSDATHSRVQRWRLEQRERLEEITPQPEDTMHELNLALAKTELRRRVTDASARRARRLARHSTRPRHAEVARGLPDT
jgi:hypothetical protein